MVGRPRIADAALVERASVFNTKKELKAGDRSAYKQLLARGLLEAATSHMVKLKTIWDRAGVIAVANNCISRQEMIDKHNGAVKWLRRNDLALLQELFPARKMARMYTEEEILSLASSYEVIAEFAADHPKAYQHSKVLGIRKKTTAHMAASSRPSNENLISRAKRYTRIARLKEGDMSAYVQIRKRNICGEAFSHMESLTMWSDDVDLIYAEAKKYDHKVDFAKGSGSAYAASRNSSEHDKICAHMDSLPSGFDTKKDGVFYYIRINVDPPLYKIGVTNRSVSARYSPRDMKSCTVISEWKGPGSIILNIETSIKRRFKRYLYSGDIRPFSGTGVSEIFTKDILNQDVAA